MSTLETVATNVALLGGACLIFGSTPATKYPGAAIIIAALIALVLSIR